MARPALVRYRMSGILHQVRSGMFSIVADADIWDIRYLDQANIANAYVYRLNLP